MLLKVNLISTKTGKIIQDGDDETDPKKLLLVGNKIVSPQVLLDENHVKRVFFIIVNLRSDSFISF
jgi:hypothetical protein